MEFVFLQFPQYSCSQSGCDPTLINMAVVSLVDEGMITNSNLIKIPCKSSPQLHIWNGNRIKDLAQFQRPQSVPACYHHDPGWLYSTSQNAASNIPEKITERRIKKEGSRVHTSSRWGSPVAFRSLWKTRSPPPPQIQGCSHLATSGVDCTARRWNPARNWNNLVTAKCRDDSSSQLPELKPHTISHLIHKCPLIHPTKLNLQSDSYHHHQHPSLLTSSNMLDNRSSCCFNITSTSTSSASASSSPSPSLTPSPPPSPYKPPPPSWLPPCRASTSPPPGVHNIRLPRSIPPAAAAAAASAPPLRRCLPAWFTRFDSSESSSSLSLSSELPPTGLPPSLTRSLVAPPPPECTKWMASAGADDGNGGGESGTRMGCVSGEEKAKKAGSERRREKVRQGYAMLS